MHSPRAIHDLPILGLPASSPTPSGMIPSIMYSGSLKRVFIRSLADTTPATGLADSSHSLDGVFSNIPRKSRQSLPWQESCLHRADMTPSEFWMMWQALSV